ncbi:hypothetical protein BT96DRAFT_916555, partial [Gymnopus androsaceus JB14]
MICSKKERGMSVGLASSTSACKEIATMFPQRTMLTSSEINGNLGVDTHLEYVCRDLDESPNSLSSWASFEMMSRAKSTSTESIIKVKDSFESEV